MIVSWKGFTSIDEMSEPIVSISKKSLSSVTNSYDQAKHHYTLLIVSIASLLVKPVRIQQISRWEEDRNTSTLPLPLWCPGSRCTRLKTNGCRQPFAYSAYNPKSKEKSHINIVPWNLELIFWSSKPTSVQSLLLHFISNSMMTSRSARNVVLVSSEELGRMIPPVCRMNLPSHCESLPDRTSNTEPLFPDWELPTSPSSISKLKVMCLRKFSLRRITAANSAEVQEAGLCVHSSASVHGKS